MGFFSLNKINANNNLLVNLPLNPSTGLSGKVAGGVTFTRGSDQWFQDGNGVWQKAASGVPAIGPNGILLEPASTNKCTCYGVIPSDTLGAELLGNGGFDADVTWTKETGWTITGGQAVATAATGTIYQTGAIAGKAYQVTFTVVSLVSGAFKARIGGMQGTPRSVPGTYTEILIRDAGGGSAIGVMAHGPTTGVIDNVSIKEVQFAAGTKSFYTGGSWVQNHTNMTLSGDTAAVLTTVDDSAALLAAGLQNICPSGKVYKLDNSAGVALSQVSINGQAANTNIHSIAVAAKSAFTGTFAQVNAGTELLNIDNSGIYKIFKRENITPTSTVRNMSVLAPAGQIVYFILPQLEELPFATSPIVAQGASASRAAIGMTTAQGANNIKGNDFTVLCTLTINAMKSAPNYPALMTANYDANNCYNLIILDNTGKVYSNKVIASVSSSTSPRIVLPTIGMQYKIAVRCSSVTGITLFIGGAAVGTQALTTDVSPAPTVITLNPATLEVSKQLKGLRVYKKPLSDAQCIALTS